MEEANGGQLEGLALVDEPLAAANGNVLPPVENEFDLVDEPLAAANGDVQPLEDIIAPVDEPLPAADGNVIPQVEDIFDLGDEPLAAANGNLILQVENEFDLVDEPQAAANGDVHFFLPPLAAVADNEDEAELEVDMDDEAEFEVDPEDEAELEVVPLVEEPDDEDELVPVNVQQSEPPLPADRQMGEVWMQIPMEGDPIQHWFDRNEDSELVAEQNWYAYRLRISSVYGTMLEGERVEDTRRRLAGNELLMFENNIDNLVTSFRVDIGNRPREDFEAITESLDREIEGALDLFGLEYQV